MLISYTSGVGRLASSSLAASRYRAASSCVKSFPSASSPPLKIGSLESTTYLLFGRFLRKPKTQRVLARCPSQGQAENLDREEVECATSDLPSPTAQISIPINSWYCWCSLSPSARESSRSGLLPVLDGLSYFLRMPKMFLTRVSYRVRLDPA